MSEQNRKYVLLRAPLSNATPISVKEFGAVGDGVTDDTAAIQAAVDSGYYDELKALVNDIMKVAAEYAGLQQLHNQISAGIAPKFDERDIRLEAECVAGLGFMREWQPIETAPKDGTLILVCGKGLIHPLLVSYRDTPSSYKWEDDYDLWPEDAFTHWMLIPELPT